MCFFARPFGGGAAAARRRQNDQISAEFSRKRKPIDVICRVFSTKRTLCQKVGHSNRAKSGCFCHDAQAILRELSTKRTLGGCASWKKSAEIYKVFPTKRKLAR